MVTAIALSSVASSAIEPLTLSFCPANLQSDHPSAQMRTCVGSYHVAAWFVGSKLRAHSNLKHNSPRRRLAEPNFYYKSSPSTQNAPRQILLLWRWYSELPCSQTHPNCSGGFFSLDKIGSHRVDQIFVPYLSVLSSLPAAYRP